MNVVILIYITIYYLIKICRLLTTGTIEEKIYQRQISKASLSESVVDLNHLGSLKLSTAELKVFFIEKKNNEKKALIIIQKLYIIRNIFTFLGPIYTDN